MDPVTHMTLGACVAIAAAPSGSRRAAGVAGLIAGLLPDADVFIRSAEDSLLAIEYHRHFTHAWVFAIVVATIAVLTTRGLRRMALGREAARTPWIPVLLAALSHPFCDLWTSYGTRVNWPFSNAREALDWVSVIDPLVMLPLLAGFAWSMVRGSKVAAVLALTVVAGYLGFAVFQKGRASVALGEYLAAQGIEAQRTSVRPSFANTIVWRGAWEAQDSLGCVAIRLGREVTITPGATAEPLRTEDLDTLAPEGSVLRGDMARFAHFSDDWLIWHPTVPEVIGDARYAMVPTSMEPLWGIGIAGRGPDEHVSFDMFRSDTPARVKSLWRLVRGVDVPSE